jgi:AraC family transcriptional regulator, positive regulator of tynA and feaB
MTSRSFSTCNVSQTQAFAYWHDLVCNCFVHLECSSPRQPEFRGSFEIQSFGNLEISSMQADEMQVRRTYKSTRISGEDYFIIPIQGASVTLGSQDGREFCLRPGDFTVFDSTRPYQASLLSTFEHCLLRVPRLILQQRLGSIDKLTAVPIAGNSGIGRVTSLFLRSLPSQLQQVDDPTRARLSEIALDLLTMALAETFAIPVRESSTVAAHRMRVRDFVEANLKREDLSVAMIGKALRLSPRHLNRLFKDEHSSLWQYIADRRLEKCRDALVDIRWSGRTIAEVAYQFGFSDASHFSRAFHRRFGVSPREYRSIKIVPRARL